MDKRKAKTGGPPRPPSRKQPNSGFYTPFKDLDQHFGTSFYNDPEEQAKPNPVIDEIERIVKKEGDGNDERIFMRAMAEVKPLPEKVLERVPARPPEKVPPRFLAIEELEAYAQLVDLVAGEGPFELSSSDEYIDGSVLGISPRVLKKLREGYFSYQDHLDLHGMNKQEAREETTQFIMRSFAARKRCVLIIPGRGLNSKDKEPVLKHNLVSWLTRAPLKRVVLAFASARSYDGGWGAFYVLLRKNEGKAPIIVPAR